MADFNERCFAPLAQSGAFAERASASNGRRLSGRFLRDILTELSFVKAITQRGVHIVGAWFVDDVDLSEIRFEWPLRLEQAMFAGKLSLRRAKIDNLLSLDGSTVAGAIATSGPERGTRVAVDMRGLKVGSSVLLRRLLFKGDVLLVGGKVDRALETDGATFEGNLDMGGLETGENLNLRSSTFDGWVRLIEAKIGRTLNANDATFAREFVLIGAKISHTFEADRSSFGGALDLGGAEVGLSVFLRQSGTLLQGDVFLVEAKVGHTVEADGATFERTLNMERLTAAQGVHLRYNPATKRAATLKGGVILVGAQVGSNLDLSGASFRARVDLTGAKVGGELRLGLPDHGRAHWGPDARLILRNAKVGAIQDRLEPEGGRELDAWPSKGALELDGLTYDRLGGWQQGDAQTSDMMARPSSWYIGWLGRNPSKSPQPYQQLAQTFRMAGLDDKANDILYAGRERERKEAVSWWRWVWLTALNKTIGYGIGLRYFRALLWVALLTAVGTALIAYDQFLTTYDQSPNFLAQRAGEDQATNSSVSPPDAPPKIVRLNGPLAMVGYSLHHLLPFVSLDKTYDAGHLGSWVRYYFYLHKLFGWVLGSFLVAGLAGLTQKR